MKTKRRMIWVGDAGCESGFARCTHQTLETLQRYWDVAVIGINYRGEPHPYDYPIYPAHIGGDLFGAGRIKKLSLALQPDFVVVQSDPWNIPMYTKAMRGTNIPVIGAVAVDGKNCRGDVMNELHLAIFWTKFAQEEAIRGGYTGKSAVVPLGVDLNVYKPLDKAECRASMGLTGKYAEGFIVGNINRNQHRKRLDLSIEYFAEWVHSRNVEDAYLFLHVAPTGDQGFECSQLAQYYGVDKLLILNEPDVWAGLPESKVVETYNCFDLQISTTQGEGWGLCTMEGMACGVPQIVPNWAALGEWPRGAALQVVCPTTAVTPNFINAIGGIVDREVFIETMDLVYRDRKMQEKLRANGLALVSQKEYRWDHIGKQFAKELATAVYTPQEEKEVAHA